MVDLLRKYKSLYSSTSSTFGTGTSETITPASVVGLPIGTEITLTFDRVDSTGTATPSKMERIIGTISGGNLAIRTSPASGRGADGSTEQAHTSPVVEMVWNSKDWNDAIDAFLVQHNQSGLHTNISACLVTASGVVTGSNFDLLASGALRDANDNELLKFTQTASAVNELTVANAVTASAVILSATGGDTNIGMDISPKGSGRIRSKSTIECHVVAGATDTAVADSKYFFRVPAELSGMNLVAVAACVVTAGTTGTTDVQIHRVRSGSSVDMLSTKITIDSTEVDTSTAATPAVIDTSNDDVVTGDQVHVDIDAISTTPSKGLNVEMTFAMP